MPPLKVGTEERQRELVGRPIWAVHEAAVDQAPQHDADVGGRRHRTLQVCNGRAAASSGDGCQEFLLDRSCTVVAILEEGQIELVEQRFAHTVEVDQLDVLEADPTANERTKELQKVGVACRLLDDLADERQPEAAVAAGERDGERLRCRIELEVADQHVSEHTLGIGPRPLQVQAERRETTDHDPHALPLALHLAKRRQQARSSIEDQLSAMYRPAGPSTMLADRIDGRVRTALTNYRVQPARGRHRALLLAVGVSLIAVMAFAGGAVAQRLALGCGISIVDGIAFDDCVVSRPGLTNIGQPFWGTDILDRTPAEAAALAAEKGYTIRWQIEERRGTESLDDDQISFSEDAPTCGRIGGGSVIEEGRIQMVVTIDDPLMAGSEC